MKNDITYEYRVFTNRLVDVEPMEVGICTSKVLKGLKQKDKVDGRFFHTSDTDEWYFCWNGQLQKLNLKGNSDVSAALAEAKKATEAAQNAATAANTAVSKANTAVSKADAAAIKADAAALSANEAVTTIDTKIAEKANKSDLDNYATIDHNHDDLYAKLKDVLTQDDLVGYVKTEDLDGYALKSDLNGLATEKYVDDKIKQIEFPEGVDLSELVKQIEGKQDVISDLETIRSGAAAGATALQSVPDYYVTETELAGMGYATTTQVDAKQDVIEDLQTIREGAALGATSIQSLDGYLTESAADEKYALKGSGSGDIDLSGKQDVITDLEDIRSKANSALQEIPSEYVTETELEAKGYLTEHQDITGKQDFISDLEAIRSGAALGATAIQSLDGYATEEWVKEQGYLTEHQSLDNYYTKEQIGAMIKEIKDMIDVAIEKTNTILA